MNEDQLNAVPQKMAAQDRDLVRVLAAVICEGARYVVCLRPGHKT